MKRERRYEQDLRKLLAYVKSMLRRRDDYLYWSYKERSADESLRIVPGRREDTAHANLTVLFLAKAIRLRKAMGMTRSPLSSKRKQMQDGNDGYQFVGMAAERRDFAHAFGGSIPI